MSDKGYVNALAYSQKNDPKAVNGYIHDVSEIFVGKQGSRYFDFKIQETPDVYTRVACFSPDKRNTIKEKEESKAAVCIVNVSPRKRKDLQSQEYTMNKYSKITDAQDLSFSWKTTPQIDNLVSLGDVLDGVASPNGEFVSVNVRIYHMSSPETVYSSSQKKYLEKCDAVVVDNESKAIVLTLWQDMIKKVDVGKSYHFQNVRAAFFKSMYLNTTRKTTIAELQPPEDIQFTKEVSVVIPTVLMQKLCPLKLRMPCFVRTAIFESTWTMLTTTNRPLSVPPVDPSH